MSNKLSYYVIQTEENREFSVKKKLISLFKEADVIVPVRRVRKSIKGENFMYFDRLMPDYVLFGVEELTSAHTDKILDIKGIVSMLTESYSGTQKPSALSKDECKRFTRSVDELEISKIITGDINVVFGQYAGFKATINKRLDDEIVVVIETRTKPKARLPLWYLAKKLS